VLPSDVISYYWVMSYYWLDRGRRDVFMVHPRSEPRRRLTGVFATRSSDRPNPLGLHRVTVREAAGNRLRVGPIEAVHGTPVIDINPVLSGVPDFWSNPHVGPKANVLLLASVSDHGQICD
jgi:tRNA-Thr(GGU) m(6)t(6)A37 methyltransferase TsaA